MGALAARALRARGARPLPEMVRLPPGRDAEAIVRDMKERFSQLRLSFETVAERKRNLGQAIEHLDGFLSLVGFVALVLAGSGGERAPRLHPRQDNNGGRPALLGASARQSFAVYLVQGSPSVSRAPALAGRSASRSRRPCRPCEGDPSLDIDFFVSWPALARGMGAGIVICLLFSLLPLVSVRRVPPLAACAPRSPSARPCRPIRGAW